MPRGRFKKGDVAGPGRPKGSPNKRTLIAKSIIEDVVTELGGAAALLKWAKKKPDLFWTLIFPKLLPLQVYAKTETVSVVYKSVEELRSALASRGIAPDQLAELLNADADRAFKTIDHQQLEHADD